MKHIYFNLSGIYQEEHNVVDLSDISGTNCYCDNRAADEIQKRLMGLSEIPDVRFIDSGNYHYMSLFFMRMICEPFSLLLLDNHPDYKESVFGNITSCGGWVREAVETIPEMKHVLMCGVDEKLIQDVSPLPDSVNPMSVEEAHNNFSEGSAHNILPLYISLDKDIMSPEFARTDWSQGETSLAEVLDLLKIVYSKYRVVGFDICGEKKENPTEEDKKINQRTNIKILEELSMIKEERST